jgi:prepilin-type N-terminal cleavage/methylation domain-containing protein
MSAPRGFTLIELLLATVLATLLMLGSLAVVADVGHDGLFAEASDPPAPSDSESAVMEALDSCVGMLREDIAHATAIHTSSENEFKLMGYCALNGRSRERAHRPVMVLYRLEEIAGRTWLIRLQASLDVMTNRNTQRDLVCSGFQRFSLVRTRETGPAPEPGQTPGAENMAEDSVPEQNPSDDITGTVLQDPEEDRGMVINGLHFYPDYIPEWARKDLGASEWVRQGVEENQKRKKQVEKPESQATPPGEIKWRLRVWTSDESESDHERVVTVSPGGTL